MACPRPGKQTRKLTAQYFPNSTITCVRYQYVCDLEQQEIDCQEINTHFCTFFKAISMRVLFLSFIIFLSACGGSSSTEAKKTISDLPFNTAADAKEYADIVLKAIRTDRDQPVYQEFQNTNAIDQDSLRQFIGMYSTAIGGRNDWEFIDVYGDSQTKDDSDGFDYAWLDPSSRLAFQIKITPVGTAKGFDLEKIEFRSRLEVMSSRGFPGGVISDYEKLDYDWEAKMERLNEKNKEEE